jgi:hypothetical protein
MKMSRNTTIQRAKTPREVTIRAGVVLLACLMATSMAVGVGATTGPDQSGIGEPTGPSDPLQTGTEQTNNTTNDGQAAETEPNNDFESATAIEPGTYEGRTITANDLDLYAIELEAGESLSASISFSHAEGDLDFYLLGPNRSVQQVSESSTDNESLSAIAGEAGTYYLVVVGFHGATATYDLTVATSGETPPPTQGESEPNDDFESATAIGPGTFEGATITDGDIDIYSIELERGDALSASINFSHAQGDLELFFLDSDGAVLQSSESTTDDESLSSIASEAGTYYLAVVGFQNRTDWTETPYTLTVTVANGTDGTAGDRFEPNDGFANATAIEPGSYDGLNITSNDVDFFAVDLQRGETLSAVLNFSHDRGDLDFYFVGPNQTMLQAAESETDNENISAVATETGTFFLVVVGFQGATGPYNLSLSTTGSDTGEPAPGDGATPGNQTAPRPTTETEPNDDFASATPVGPGSYGGLEISENDIDIYAVEVNASESISASISFSNARGDLDLFLVGPNTDLRQASTSSADVESGVDIANQSGTYFVVVTGFEGATGPYNLTIDITPEVSRPDPATDVIGWENGYWANETVEVDTTDGLTEPEREALLARGMARVEEIRDREFQRPVEFEVLSREEYVSITSSDPLERLTSTAYYNQVYEATFIVDEQTDAYDEVSGEAGGTTGGFYIFGTDQIFLIAEDPERPVVDEGILVHELTHALQDQLELTAFDPRATADGRTARLGLTEGEANYVMARYESQCLNGTWECVPTASANDSPPDFNLGIYLTGYQPYSDGPALVARLSEQGGWEAVEEAYDSPPVSTEQTIHPERYPDEQPGEIATRPAASGEWQRFGTETLGEAWIYSMFWYQAHEYNISIIDGNQLLEPDAGPVDTYNYTSTPSEGWGNDQLSLYTNGSDYGYVWTTAWDSETDARQFEEAYQQILDEQGGQSVGPSTWRIPESNPYADAFRVVRDGTTVTIVNGPDEASLREIAPDVSGTNETASSP